MRLTSSWIALALVSAAGSVASADVEPAAADPAATTAAAPAGDGAAPAAITLPKGRVLVDAFVDINLSSSLAFKPVSLSPDIWYGVSDALTVGLTHSQLGETGFVGAGGIAGDSLCLTGSSSGCAHFYNNVGLDARYALTHGNLSWAFDGGLDFRSLASPFALALKVGAIGRWTSGKIAVELEPELFLGLTNRDSNKDALGLPLGLLYGVAPKIAVGVQSGVILPLENTGSTWGIPLSIGAHYRVSTPLSVSLAFSFPDLIGGGNAGGSLRTLSLGGSYAF